MIFSKSHISVWSEESASGRNVMVALQNRSIPELDLLVREAVQNSSDAAIGSNGKNVYVDFRVGDFDAQGFNREFVGLEEALPEFTAGLPARYLEIRDKKTSGLTGDYRRPDSGDHSNFIKLIYGLGETQEAGKESGGSWGYGKSVYYRASSVGLVIFYTHINDPEHGSEHRLIAVLVENSEEKQNCILDRVEDAHIGRAWWGAPAEEGSGINVFPILDLDAIRSFLNLFGLEPFKESDTGTSVIIPYIDEKKLLSDVVPRESLSEEDLDRCVWRNDVGMYIAHALKKWYAPKLDNKRLSELAANGKAAERWIRASVNGEVIMADEDLGSFFQLIQELYTTARFKVSGLEYKSELFPGIKSDEIDLRRTKNARFGGRAGVVAYIEITDAQLYPGYSGLSPYVLTGNFENLENINEPIVAFTRQLGMVLSYNISGEWVKEIPSPKSNPGSPDNGYLVGFFVPDTTRKFDAESDTALYGNLGGYLKSCEKADHTSWDDQGGMKIVGRIQKNVCRKIKDSLEETRKKTAEPATESRLSNRLGRFFMPPVDDGPRSAPKRSGGSSSAPSGRSGRFEVGRPSFEDGYVKVPFALPVGDHSRWNICLEARSEKGNIKIDSWAKEVGSAYPLAIERIEVVLQAKDGSSIGANASRANSRGVAENAEKLEVTLDRGAVDEFACARIACTVPGQVVKGVAWLVSSDNKIECDLKAYAGKGE